MEDVYKVGSTDKAVKVEYNGQELWFAKKILKGNGKAVPAWAVKQKTGEDTGLNIIGEKGEGEAKPEPEPEPEPEPANEAEAEAQKQSEEQETQEPATQPQSQPAQNPQIVIAEALKRDDIKVEVTRGQKGTYGWTVTNYGNSKDEVIPTIKEVDQALRELYANEG